jgi:hypothetical protein
MKTLFLKQAGLIMAVALLAVMFSCSKEESSVQNVDLEVDAATEIDEQMFIDEALSETASKLKCSTSDLNICSDISVLPLIAAGRYYVGAVVSYTDETNLNVIYVSFGYLRFNKINLFVGDLSEMPLNDKNNPQPRYFNYKYNSDYGYKYKRITIPLSDLNGCFAVAAHAKICDYTVWAYTGESFADLTGGNRWGWALSEYCPERCCDTHDDLVAIFKSHFNFKLGNCDDCYTNTVEGYLVGEKVMPTAKSWCKNLTYVELNEGITEAPIRMVKDTLGYVVFDQDCEKIDVSVSFNDGHLIKEDFLYIGTLENFYATYDTTSCLDPHTFPFVNTVDPQSSNDSFTVLQSEIE